MRSNRGHFITFEGGDGSGKTTQLRLLAGRLRGMGFEVLETAEPGGTSIGMQIRRILLDSANQELCPTAEMLLYFAARAQNVEQWIRPALDRGAVVLSDRFTDSTLAYQGAGRGLGRDVVLTLHDIACGGLHPDLTVCIDIDVSTSLARAHARNSGIADKDEKRMDEQAADFHARVREAYLQLAAAYPGRIRIVDGGADPAVVSDRIWSIVSGALGV